MTGPAQPHTWADLVFHVLAHVASEARAPASLHWPAYAKWCARAVGHPHKRDLGAACEMLAHVLPSHDTLRDVQLLAWVFATPKRAMESIGRGLEELTEVDVDDVAALRALRKAGAMAAADLLRGAAVLEAPYQQALPMPPVPDFGQTLEALAPVAPALRRCAVQPLRPLGPHGRVYRDVIYTGVPALCDGHPHASDVAWQAAHEGTVVEVQAALRSSGLTKSSERVAEALALQLLAHRVRGGALAQPHAIWLASRGPEAVRVARQVPDARFSPLFAKLGD